jgi:membrane fusion protein (multidrug efflux system)
MRAYFTISQQLVTELQQRLQAEGRALRSDKDGPELQLTLASGYVYPIKGKARFADNKVDVSTGSVRVVGEFPNPNDVLIPGMFVRVRALMGMDKGALLIPQRAVSQMQGRYLVAVVESDNKVSIRPVEAGQRVGEEWVVKGKLGSGDRVVAEGVQKVRDGMVVNAYKPPTTQRTMTQASAQTP